MYNDKTTKEERMDMTTNEEKRDKFLNEYGVEEGDIMEDELGREFIYSIDEDGVRYKVYVPHL